MLEVKLIFTHVLVLSVRFFSVLSHLPLILNLLTAAQSKKPLLTNPGPSVPLVPPGGNKVAGGGGF